MNTFRKHVLFGVLSVALFSFAFASATAFAGSAFAYESPGKPSGFVNDFAGVLDADAKSSLEASLVEFEKATTTEVSVVTVPNMGGDYIENYAEKLFQEWGIGKAKEDNGVLLLVAMEERELRIEVGYGLEGALTDLESGQIIDNVMVPAFKAGDFAGGIVSGATAIQEAVRGEYTAPAGGSNAKDDVGNLIEVFGPFVFIFVVNFFFAIRHAVHSAASSHAVWPGAVFGAIIAAFIGLIAAGSLASFVVLVLVSSTFGLLADYVLSRAAFLNGWREKARAKKDKNKGGGWWFFGGGGGHGGGFGGGGFGGFGGGSSGGGGASGRW